MSVINRTITEQELWEIKHGLLAVLRNTAKEPEKLANDLTYAVFRNILEPESVRRWIINRARKDVAIA